MGSYVVTRRNRVGSGYLTCVSISAPCCHTHHVLLPAYCCIHSPQLSAINERANAKVEGLEKEVDEAIQRAVEGASTGIEEQAERTSAELREHMAAVEGAMNKRVVSGAVHSLLAPVGIGGGAIVIGVRKRQANACVGRVGRGHM